MNTRNTYTKDHTQMINDSTQITGSNRNSPALVDLLTLVFVLQWLSLHGKILIMLLPQFLLTFIQIQSGCSFPWHSSLFSCWLGRSVMIWEILHGRIHLNWVFLLLLLLLNFASRCRLELMLYSSSKIFGQPLCCLYCLRCLSCCYCSYKFPLLRQASNPCKTILQAAKLAYANKIRVYHFPQNTMSWLLGNR